MKIGIIDERLSRAERRRRELQIRKLNAAAARMLESDARYFKRFKHRNHRVRLAATAEIDGLRIASGEALLIPPDMRVFTVVHQIAPGLHEFRWVPLHADAVAELDVLDETLSAAIWAKAVSNANRGNNDE